jgi:hypothetical protein
MTFVRENVQAAMAELAGQGIFVGTSSWKYAGWRGQLYSDDRYVWRVYVNNRLEGNALKTIAGILERAAGG